MSTTKQEPEQVVVSATAEPVSTSTTTAVQPDGSTKVIVEETMADGSKQVKTTVYPAGMTPPPAGVTTALPPAAASAARAAAPPPVTPSLGRLPSNHTCQFCQHTGQTQVKEKFGTCAVIALVVLLVCFWPLFWLPLVMPSCKDKKHICSNCQRQVGENEADCDTCCKAETH